MLSSPNDESPANVDAAVGVVFLLSLCFDSMICSFEYYLFDTTLDWTLEFNVHIYRTTWYKCFDFGS